VSGRILLLGGTGLLGRATAAELTRRGRTFDAPDRAELDLTAIGAVPPAIEARRPSAIVNLAAFTDVAGAEKTESLQPATLLNVALPAALAAAASRLGIPMVHISTDYVFDGAKRTPYEEDDPVRPIQVYGRTKLDGERAALAAHRGLLVLRVSTLYGPHRAHRPAYVDAILAQARALAGKGGGELAVVVPPVSSPTYAPDVAPVLLDLLDRGVTGIVHTVNDGAASRLELAAAAVRLAGFADRVTVVPRPEPPNTLERPAYSVLGTAKLKGLLGRVLPPWEDAVARYVEMLG
jgi:dTDP-4-dehydrorhamnose reductase